MLSKNAIGNLVNRYKAILKKCNLLNTFGTLAIACTFCFSGASTAQAIDFTTVPPTPTLEEQAIKEYLKTLTYDDDHDPDTSEVRVYSDKEVDAISSGYTIEEFANEDPLYPSHYYRSITVKTFGDDGSISSKEYGLLLKDPAGGTELTNVRTLIDNAIVYEKINEYKIVNDNRRQFTFMAWSPEHYYNYNGLDNWYVEDWPGLTLYSVTGPDDSKLSGTYIGKSKVGEGQVEDVQGGALYNETENISIADNFIGNMAYGNHTYQEDEDGGHAYGGGIYNQAQINIITADFIANKVLGGGDYSSGNAFGADAFGGAIYSNAGINSITANFTGNNASGGNGDKNGGNAYGGAIYSNAIINSITVNFLANSAVGGVGHSVGALWNIYGGDAYGGAIYKTSDIGIIKGSFIHNSAIGGVGHVVGTSLNVYAGDAYGGAIYNSANINTITANFIANSALGGIALRDRTNDEGITYTDGYAYGGAIYNAGKISTITGDFIENKATSSGGAIHNLDVIDTITGDFIGNLALQHGGGAIQQNGATINTIRGDFIGNSGKNGNGGAIDNNKGKINTIVGDFINNSTSLSGGAISNTYSSEIGNIIGDFIENYCITPSYGRGGGAIYNSQGSKISSIVGNFIDNHGVNADGGAIYNTDSSIGVINGSFRNNRIINFQNDESKGGAIYTNSELNFLAYNGVNTFSGNYTSQDREVTKNYNAIYFDTANASSEAERTLTFTMSGTNSGFVIDDSILFSANGIINIVGDKTTEADIFSLNNEVKNATTVNINDTTLKLGSVAHGDEDFSGNLGSATVLVGDNSFIEVDSDDIHFNGTMSGTGSLNINVNKGFGIGADNLTIAIVRNNGNLNLQGGLDESDIQSINNINISGSGTINIKGYISNDKAIANNINVNSAGVFTNTGNITGNLVNNGTMTTSLNNIGTVTNNNSLYLQDSSINETISGSGTTYLTENITFLGSSANIAGILNLDSQSIDMQEENTTADYSTRNIGSIIGTGHIQIDADLTENNVKNDKLNLENINNATITLSSVNVRVDGLANSLSYLVGETTGITFDIPQTAISTVNGDYTYTFTQKSDGTVDISRKSKTISLESFITGREIDPSITTYAADMDQNLTTALTTGGRNVLFLNLNSGYDLLGDNRANNGIIVAETYSLTLSGSENSEMSGFDTALNNNSVLNIKDLAFENNNTDITNNGTLNLSGLIAINQGITGLGNTTITNGTTTANAISQNSLTIENSAVLNVNAKDLTITTFTNNGTVNLGAGTLTESISGTGTTFITDTVINTAFISAALTINNGKVLSSGTANIGGVVNNLGTLNLTGGNDEANRQSITTEINGGGLTNLDAYILNEKVITGNINVNSEADFINRAKINGNLVNNGLTRTSLSEISGTLTNNHELYIEDASISKNIEGDGTSYLTQESTYLEIDINGTLNLNAQTLSLQDLGLVSYSTRNIGSISGSGQLAIDVDLSDANIENDKLNITDGSNNNGSIALTNINITNAGTEEGTFTFLSGKIEGLTINVGEGTSLSTASGEYLYIFTESLDGAVNVSREVIEVDLAKYLTADIVDIFSVNEDTNVSTVVQTNRNKKDLAVYLNHATDLLGDSNNGIKITDGYSLIIDGSHQSGSQISGFNTALNVQQAGILSLNNVSFSANTIDIDNDGTLNLDGKNNINNIVGIGSSNVVSGTTEMTSILQNSLTIQNEATFNITDINKLRVDSLSNSGTLNMGNETEIDAVFNGELTSTETGKTNVKSYVDFNQTLNSSGTTTFERGASLKDLNINNGVTTFKDTSSITGELLVNGGSLVINAPQLKLTDQEKIITTKNLNVSNGSLLVQGGTLDTTGGKLSLASSTTEFNLAGEATLKSQASDFGIISSSGDFTKSIGKQLVSDGSLVLNVSNFTEMNFDNYNIFLGNFVAKNSDTSESFAMKGNGTVELNGVNIIVDPTTSLDNIRNNSSIPGATFSGGTLGSNVNAKIGSVTGDVTSNGSLEIVGVNGVLASGEINNNGGQLNLGSGTAGNLNNNGGEINIKGRAKVESTNNAGVIYIKNDASLETEKLTANPNDLIHVGEADDAESSGGNLKVTEGLTLRGAKIFLDPAWKDGIGIEGASTGAIAKFDSGSIDGSLIVGQNSYIVLGESNLDWAKQAFADYNTLKWGQNDISAALFIKQAQSIDSGNGAIFVDGTLTTPNNPLVGSASFANNSLLVLNAETLGNNVGLTADTINTVGESGFDKGDGAKLLITDIQLQLHGKTTVNVAKATATDGLKIALGSWGNADGSGAIDKNSLIFENKFYSTSKIIFDNNGTYSVEIGTDAEAYPKMNRSLAALTIKALSTPDLDYPVKMFIDNANSLIGDPNQDGSTGEGAAKMGVTSNAMGNVATVADLSSQNVNNRLSFIGAGESKLLGNNNGVINYNGENMYLVATTDLAGLGGKKQMLNGFGMWVQPMYQHTNADGFDSGGYKYGYDTDLYGLSVGGDFTFNNAFRLGLAAHMGNGDSESGGDFNNTKNDFAYYGFSLYGGYLMGNMVFSADLGYSQTSNEVNQDQIGGSLESDFNASTISAGIKAEYKFETSNGLDIVPHIAARINHTEVDSFDSKQNNATIFKNEESNATTFAIPIGIALSKEFATASGMKIVPSIDAGIQFAFGDLDVEQEVRIAGVNGSATMESEIFDPITFKGGVGVDIVHKNLTFGLNYSIDASSNLINQRVMGTIRFEF